MIEIRSMTANDLPAAMKLKEAEGWNQVAWDWQTFLFHNADYCLVAAHQENVVGTVTAFSYQNQVAWIGMMLVEKQHRGQGIGTRLLKEVISRLEGRHRTIKLDATPMGRPVYEKLGFRSEQIIHRMTAEGLIPGAGNQPSVLPVKPHLEKVVELDLQTLGYDRSVLLKALNERYEVLSNCSLQNKRIQGYLLGRRGSNFTHLGPLIAENPDTATKLISGLLQSVGPQPVLLDIVEDQKKVIEWLKHLGFREQRTLLRMYLGQKTAEKVAFQYLITGPEFG